MGRGPNPVEVNLSEEEEKGLDKLVKRRSTRQQIVWRARIIQAAAKGMNNAQIGRALGMSVDSVRLWRNRWVESQAVTLKEEGIEARLSDEPRNGSPGKFSAEQMAQIIAIACEDPATSGYPVSHWSAKEIAMEAVKRGVVESISERHVGRFLK